MVADRENTKAEDTKPHSQVSLAQSSEPAPNVAIFKTGMLLHKGSINEIRQWQKRFLAYYKQNLVQEDDLPMQRSFLITCLDDELATVIHNQHAQKDVNIYGVYMNTLTQSFDSLHPLYVRLHRLTILDRESDDPAVFFNEFMRLTNEADTTEFSSESILLALMTFSRRARYYITDPSMRSDNGKNVS